MDKALERVLVKTARANNLTIEEAVYLLGQGLEKLSWEPLPEGITMTQRMLAERELINDRVRKAMALARIHINAENVGLINKGNMRDKIEFGSPKKDNNKNKGGGGPSA